MKLPSIPYLKLAPYLAIALLVAALLLTRGTLDNTKAELGREIEFRELVGRHFACPASDRNTIATCLSNALSTSENRREALERISREAEANKTRADLADAALAREQAEHQRQFAAAQRTINDLRGRRPTGDAAQDIRVIEQDSQAAWRGWR